MSLAAKQKFQARFYTDSDLRKRSLADPESVAKEFEINAQEVKSMVEQGGKGMQVFTTALIRKRYKQASALLPGTAAALGKEFQKLFESYAEKHPIPNIYRHESDALAFATGLKGELEPELREFLRYECLVARWQARPPRLAWARFRYPVTHMAMELPKRRAPGDTKGIDFRKKSTWVISWNPKAFGWGGEQRYWVWPK